MRCRHIHQVLLYWSGELSPKVRKQMEQHLAVCPECRQVLADLGDVEQEVSRLPVIEPQRDLIRTAVEQQRAREQRPFPRFPVPMVQFAAAMTIVVSLGVWYFWGVGRPVPSIDRGRRPYVAFTVRLDSLISPQITDVRQRVGRLKERMQPLRFRRGGQQTGRHIVAETPSSERLSHVRSDMKDLKTRLVKRKRRPFHKTLNTPGRKTNENNSYYDDRRDNHVRTFRSFNLC